MNEKQYTREIVCPHCGHEFSDSWEYGRNDDDIGTIECVSCEKAFNARRIVTIEYCTEVLENERA